MFHFEETIKYADEFAEVYNHITWSGRGLFSFEFYTQRKFSFFKRLLFIDFIYHELKNNTIEDLVHKAEWSYLSIDKTFHIHEDLDSYFKKRHIEQTILKLEKRITILFNDEVLNTKKGISHNATLSHIQDTFKGFIINPHLFNYRDEIIFIIYDSIYPHYVDVSLDKFAQIFSDEIPRDFAPILWKTDDRHLGLLINQLNLSSKNNPQNILINKNIYKTAIMLFTNRAHTLNNKTLCSTVSRRLELSDYPTINKIIQNLNPFLKKMNS